MQPIRDRQVQHDQHHSGFHGVGREGTAVSAWVFLKSFLPYILISPPFVNQNHSKQNSIIILNKNLSEESKQYRSKKVQLNILYIPANVIQIFINNKLAIQRRNISSITYFILKIRLPPNRKLKELTY